MRPLIRFIAEHGDMPTEQVEQWQRSYKAERVPFAALRDVITTLGRVHDSNMVLELGASADTGLYGYLTRTAPTIRQVIEAAVRYFPLVSDALYLRLQLDNSHAAVRIEDNVDLTTREMAFVASLLHSGHLAFVDGASEIVWSFPYAEPSDSARYPSIFFPATVRFEAPYFGYDVHDANLRREQWTADPTLHEVFRKFADNSLARVCAPSWVRAAAEAQVARLLRSGRPTLAKVAASVGTKPRTLVRRLNETGTSFTQIVEASRFAAAIEYLERSPLSVKEISERLHLAGVPSFHRMFMRWTGITPLAYRKLVRTGRSMDHLDRQLLDARAANDVESELV